MVLAQVDEFREYASRAFDVHISRNTYFSYWQQRPQYVTHVAADRWQLCIWQHVVYGIQPGIHGRRMICVCKAVPAAADAHMQGATVMDDQRVTMDSMSEQSAQQPAQLPVVLAAPC